MLKARQLYTAIIRSAAAYASPIWYTTSQKPGKRSRMANQLATHQNKALRIVTGAYKATRVRQLETEAFIPLVDIWLEAKTAYFHRRLERTGMTKLILSLSAPIRRQVLRRRRFRTSIQPVTTQTPFEKARADALKWFRAEDFESCNGRPKTRILRNWKTRWRKETGHRPSSNWTETSPGLVLQDTEPTAVILKLHKDLRKSESSILIQARTECIGLNQFLYKRRVPGIPSPNCICSSEPETTRHLVQYCTRYQNREALHLSPTSRQRIDYRRLTGTPSGAKALAK